MGPPEPLVYKWPQTRGHTYLCETCYCRRPAEELEVRSGFKEWYGWSYAVRCSYPCEMRGAEGRRFASGLEGPQFGE